MKKLMNKKGFTLMEMLIVVAIIVILVAISIPTFSSQLDNAKKATDDANLRAAKGIAQTRDMMDGWGDIIGDEEGEITLYYNIDDGAFQTADEYDGGAYKQSTSEDGEVITVVIEKGALKSGPVWGDAPAE